MPGGCVNHVRVCPPLNGKAVHSFITITTFAGGRTVITPFCPGDTAAGTPRVVPITADTVRASVEKVLPQPVIGSAPPANATPLVNVQVITWVKNTDGQVDLGSATLLGRKVDFRGRVTSVDWNFGDGATDTSDGPGRSYDFAVNPCRTLVCPGYFGHVYAKRGPVIVTARVSWFAQFRVDGGAWTDIGPVQSRVGELAMTIHSAHTVLVR